MRALNSIVGSISLVGLMACGGGSHPQIIDVMVPPDAPVDAFACEFMMLNIDTNTKCAMGVTPPCPLDFATDFNGGPVTLNAVATMDTPPVLFAGIRITGIFGTMHPNTTLELSWRDKSGIFGTAEAGAFAKPPTVSATTTYAIDSDVDNTFGASVDIITYAAGTGGPDTSKPLQGYFKGSDGLAKVKLTRWTAAAVANGTSTFDTETDTDNMDGSTIDAASGNLTPDSCKAQITALGLKNVAVKWPATLPAVQRDPRDHSWFQTVELKHPLAGY
jgi:hypothetical protein